MGINFLGRKESHLDWLMPHFEKAVGSGERTAVDLFSGSGSVSAELRRRGFTVTANDMMELCANHARTLLLNDPNPSFEKMDEIIGKSRENRYQAVIDKLNLVKGQKKFITMNYSPASQPERLYFTEENARLIDGMRTQILEWNEDDLLSDAENALLLTNLVAAADTVSNTAGTYGHFLSKFKRSAKRRIALEKMDIPSGPMGVVHNKDAVDIATEVDARVAYLDPPYTKRQYAAYYHLPDTIVRWDGPKISEDSKSGLRSWEDLASDFCYKRKAEGALEEIVVNLSHTPVETILMSYNSDGQMNEDQIRKVLGEHTVAGEVEVVKADSSRYEAGAERSETYQERENVQEWLFIAELRDR